MDSGDSDLELGEEDDDDVVEIKPAAFKRALSRGMGVAGSGLICVVYLFFRD